MRICQSWLNATPAIPLQAKEYLNVTPFLNLVPRAFPFSPKGKSPGNEVDLFCLVTRHTTPMAYSVFNSCYTSVSYLFFLFHILYLFHIYCFLSFVFFFVLWCWWWCDFRLKTGTTPPPVINSGLKKKDYSDHSSCSYSGIGLKERAPSHRFFLVS